MSPDRGMWSVVAVGSVPVTVVWAVSVAMVATVLVLAGCSAGPATPGPQDASDPTGETLTVTPPASAGAEDEGAAADTPDGTVLMMGRSVMADWFRHWGVEPDPDGSVRRGGRTFVYGQLPGPPDIADAARTLIDEHPDASVAFFKFCFVDFTGEGGETDRLTSWVEEVADHAARRDTVLIVGTALPRVPGETDAVLVDEHRAFDARVRALASERADVVVCDLNGVLADEYGTLCEGFEVAPGDSHLSPSAYAALQPELEDALERARIPVEASE